MTQQDSRMQEAREYIRHQSGKALGDLAALMERTSAECARALDGVSDEQAAFHPDEEWSIKQVVEHMLSSGAAVNREIENLVEGAETAPPGRTGVTRAGDRPMAELRERMGVLWHETCELVASSSPDAMPAATWDHPIFGPLNFKEWIAFQRLHALDHVQQMEKVKAHADYPAPVA